MTSHSKSKMNNKGQIQSIILVIVTIFIIGVLFFFSNHLSNSLYGGLDEYFNSTAEYNSSEARSAVQDIRAIDNSAWDYAFLAIYIGFIIQMLIFSYATRISIVFFWLYGIIGIIGLIVAVMISNTWQEMAGNSAFSETITHFPITNALLGNYFMVAVTAMILIVIIATFGKSPEQSGGTF